MMDENYKRAYVNYLRLFVAHEKDITDVAKDVFDLLSDEDKEALANAVPGRPRDPRYQRAYAHFAELTEKYGYHGYDLLSDEDWDVLQPFGDDGYLVPPFLQTNMLVAYSPVGTPTQRAEHKARCLEDERQQKSRQERAFKAYLRSSHNSRRAVRSQQRPRGQR